MNFSEKYGPWALIAGASEGIGLEFAKTVASRGVNLILIARREEKLIQCSKSLMSEYGVEVIPLSIDLSKEEAIQNIIELTNEYEIGLMIYNAALPSINWFINDDADFHKMMITVNCLGPALLTHYFVKKMKLRGKGGIILMSSMAGLQGSPGISHYAATKAYNLVLAEGLWDELKAQGIDIIASIAGATSTQNYLDSKPKKISIFEPPVLPPDKVVKETLKYLGKRPSIIPGKWNRMASWFMHKLSSRKKATLMMGKTTREMYNHYLK